jgi:hypothetical protein
LLNNGSVLIQGLHGKRWNVLGLCVPDSAPAL